MKNLKQNISFRIIGKIINEQYVTFWMAHNALLNTRITLFAGFWVNGHFKTKSVQIEEILSDPWRTAN